MHIRCYRVTPCLASELDFCDGSKYFLDKSWAEVAAMKYACGTYVECEVEIVDKQMTSCETVRYWVVR